MQSEGKKIFCPNINWVFRYFEKGGLLITNNGDNDEKIKPENLDYVVPVPHEGAPVLDDPHGAFSPLDR